LVFPRQNLPLPRRLFPFNPSVRSVANSNTRLPLSPYCNPLFAQLRQSRCFPQQDNPVLSLFCKDGFQKRFGSCRGHRQTAAGSSFPTYSLKAGYTARNTRFCASPCRFIPGSYAKRLPIQEFSTSSHNTRSPRKSGRILHAIGVRPGSLTPSIHPKLGVKSRHQGLHRCALHRIFRPYLGTGYLD